jgi:cell division protein FtsZ
MPSVEDFPIVGQREYWAKAGGTGREQPQAAPQHQRKSTLLQKLTGGSRDRPSDPRQISERPAEEPLDLPVFFRRDHGA